ncbi:LysR family transcriptional regulator [Pseudooceanicola sp. CBS1P-1]|uniref:LysR family transcriptional regulator n=1 Tax=Pseudooceanicola albus TaxID=2692189 RepID=A0A6L7GAS8_9RHOB|nr:MULTISPECIES: LysR family transcriptional regulator [Pseudooceanicola]MBT9386581.1 LysR family transcriptional regulator [Pseudooceanicola endophyticus]MXN20697.1 LysR family transcriptional regulator [Pseudooceanicola albus]
MARLQAPQDSDIRLLRHFCAIVDEGGFSAAQAALGVSQSVLSESVKALELRLGASLCQRGPKGFRLFPEGEATYKAAQRLFAEVEVFRASTSDLSRLAQHEVSVAVQESILEHPKSRIPEALARLQDSHPNVHFHLEVMLGTQVIGRVADGLMHVGIGIPGETRAQLYVRPLFEERSMLCCGVGHPFFNRVSDGLRTEEVDAVAHVTSGKVESFFSAPIDAQARGDVGRGARAQLALILSGRNVGYVPRHIAAPLLASGKLKELCPGGKSMPLTNTVYAMTGPSSKDIAVVRYLVDIMAKIHSDELLTT